MLYSVDISSAEITIGSDLYWLYEFTLTVNAVNDAPVLLQPLEALEILEESWAAAMVQSTFFSDLESDSLLYSVDISSAEITIGSDLYWLYEFTLTVNTVNDAPVLLQPLEALEILEESWAAAMVQSIVFGAVVHPTFKFL
jgi:hypothetical protein